MNKIVLAGRMVRDPELRTTNTGTEVCSFTIAVDRRFKDQTGERQADFINCTAWQKTGVFVDKYFKKGDGITLEGRLESRKYVDKDGQNRTAWDVICDNVEFALGKAGGGNVAQPVSNEWTEVEDDGDLPF